MDTLSVCAAIPKEGEPCDLGSAGTLLTCPCELNLTCSHLKSTRLSYYRQKYYKCLCKYPEKEDRCNRYKDDMEKHEKHAGSVCKPQSQPKINSVFRMNKGKLNFCSQFFILQCESKSCDEGECCLSIACGQIEKKSNVDTISVCSSIPQNGDSCDPESERTALTCPCGQNLTCSNSGRTQYAYYREKYYRCLCRYSDDSKRCEKYMKDMEKQNNNPGPICVPALAQTVSLYTT